MMKIYPNQTGNEEVPLIFQETKKKLIFLNINLESYSTYKKYMKENKFLNQWGIWYTYQLEKTAQ